jgi:hypothetical protein
MDPSDFDMRTTSNCICGHALRMFGQQEEFYFDWRNQLRAGASLLGLSNAQAVELFSPPHRSGSDEPYTSPQDAARVVRYLAATDSVDWSVAGAAPDPLTHQQVLRGSFAFREKL